jgi:hypothetical protein
VASAKNALKLRMFPLSLFGTAFTYFTSLAPNSVFTWAQLEQKIHECFYSGDTELRLSHLTAIKQKYNESAAEYIRRFRDTKNWCFNLNIFDKNLADLTYSGLTPYLKDKLESHMFSDVAKSCSGLWIVRAEPKSLEIFLEVVKSLGMSVTLIQSNIVAKRRTMKRPTCV